jgi:hypothetical protein
LGASGAWLAEALCVVGGAAGDLVPAQLGALDGVLALGAPGLGLTAAAVVVLGLVLHAVQLAAALVSGVAAASLSFAPLPRSHPSPVPQT